MDEETEIGWMTLADRSELVLTASHVVQRAERGIFGASQIVMRRDAITSVRVSWQRSRGLLVAGVALVALYVLVTLSSQLVPGRWPQLAEVFKQAGAALAAIQYGALAGGIGFVALFWLDRQPQIEIRAGAESVGGVARSYEEAQEFSWLLLPELTRDSGARLRAGDDLKPPREATDQDWRL
ncbi:MAG TPA: hypothetical protein VNO43_05435 [Candidatus Eisenbacteria bacterium]|nr:hypothetical protein [Candidatus Eisenbacteria bacterium]